MRQRTIITALGALLAVLAGLRAAPAAAGPGAVFVLAVANAESFDRDLPTLRYAHDDVARFARVMTRTGMVAPDHVIVLEEAKSVELQAAFATIRRQLQAEPAPKFLFYYTGHSDATGLHLADGLLRKEALHALIASIPADAHIAFFDGCYSGALAAKGVKPAGDFIVPKVELDAPTGSVFLASTSGTDVAFEVEELQGSLFSHHVVDGLYGAADGNHDGLVTIDELYQHVYKQMAAYASSLPAGRAQKPEYRVDLEGRGALVLSYLDRTTAPVDIDAAIGGEVTLASSDGLQVYRVQKQAGVPLRLLLVPGDYAVTVRDGDAVGQGRLGVLAAQAAHLGARDVRMRPGQNLDLVAKGKRPEARWGVAAGVAAGSFERAGPFAEVQVATPSVRVESTQWRLVAHAGGRSNRLFYKTGGLDQSGTAQTASALVGAGGTFSQWCLEGQQWQVLVGGGADYAWQRWTQAGARTFAPWMPKAVAGLGTTFTRDSGRTWGLAFRREFPFATERGSGDVLAFGESLAALSVEW